MGSSVVWSMDLHDNWVVDVLFMVETPPVFFVSMASILDITKNWCINCLDVCFFHCTSCKGQEVELQEAGWAG